MRKKESVIKDKLLFTVLVLGIYIIGRCIPLYGVDTVAYADSTIGVEEILIHVIGGDTYQYSLFALGISPYIIASLLIQIIMLCGGADFRSKVSPKKMNRLQLFVMLVLALSQAFSCVNQLKFVDEGGLFYLAMAVAMLEMVAGAMIVLLLGDMNRKYGVGGQTVLILVNIASGIRANVEGYTWKELVIPFVLSAAVMVIILIMENTEKRIPLQRVSIHNIYADKNYMAIKYNPIGVMPVMFSTAVFMLPRLLVTLLGLFFPANHTLIWWQENLSLTSPLGIVVYIVSVYALTIGFSLLFINPKDVTEQFLKNGDSILNIHAGKDTKKYLRKNVLCISLFSATVMGICLGIPLVLRWRGDVEGALAMLPSSAMMMTGMICNFGREAAALHSYDVYKRFALF